MCWEIVGAKDSQFRWRRFFNLWVFWSKIRYLIARMNPHIPFSMVIKGGPSKSPVITWQQSWKGSHHHHSFDIFIRYGRLGSVRKNLGHCSVDWSSLCVFSLSTTTLFHFATWVRTMRAGRIAFILSSSVSPHHFIAARPNPSNPLFSSSPFFSTSRNPNFSKLISKNPNFFKRSISATVMGSASYKPEEARRPPALPLPPPPISKAVSPISLNSTFLLVNWFFLRDFGFWCISLNFHFHVESSVFSVSV